MSRFQAAVTPPISLMIVTVIAAAGYAQISDDFEQRVTDLETRVDNLETEVNLLKRAVGEDSSAPPTSVVAQTFIVQGAFTLTGNPGGPYQAISHGGASATTCTGAGPYSDIGSGVEVTVTDESGAIIGNARFETGSKTDNITCVFAFSVEVPQAEFYTFTVGERGELSYSFDEMEQMGWTISFGIDG